MYANVLEFYDVISLKLKMTEARLETGMFSGNHSIKWGGGSTN